MRYTIEAGIETKHSLTTRKKFSNAGDLAKYIKTLNPSTWYTVEYSRTCQLIMAHNFCSEGTVYAEKTVIPKALLGL